MKALVLAFAILVGCGLATAFVTTAFISPAMADNANSN